MDLGEKAYGMRLNGMMWTQIAELQGCKPNSALQAAEKYALKNNLPFTKEKRKKSTKTKQKTYKKSVETMDAIRWDKMHCGKGMVSSEIAKLAGVDVEVVRQTLKKYREQLYEK